LIGQTLSHFKITAKLGEGGMGEVYRAEDTNLGREVAIKVLPKAFTEDPERFARFEREAHVLASLNHPNIAAIYDLVEDQGIHFLVLELAKGEDLATRLSSRPIAVADALPLALQIAEAMEAAHEKGIVHRDLKPANVMVDPDDKIKVLDFGLAKAHQAAKETSPDTTRSPTLTAQMTQAGVILGTAAYMSPEQARGQEADPRADIWALGVLLWEMLVGERLFSEPTASDTLAAVLRAEIDFDALPTGTPRRLHRILGRCLAREPRQRYHSAADLRIDLVESLSGDEDAPMATAGPASSGRLPWIATTVATVLALVFVSLAFWRSGTETDAAMGSRILTSIMLPDDLAFARDADAVALSPDGTQLAFVGIAAEGPDGLWIRPLARDDVRRIAKTEGAYSPFWSPDGRWLAFGQDRDLKIVEIESGLIEVLAPMRGSRGGSWNRRGDILFTDLDSRIATVKQSGGAIRPVTEAPRRGDNYFRPTFLPDGKHFLFHERRYSSDEQIGRIRIGSLDGQPSSVLFEAYSMAEYVEPGFILWWHQGNLRAQGFDADRLEFVGEPFSVVPDILWDPRSAVAGYTASDTGILIHRSGGRIAGNQLSWIRRDGEIAGTVGTAGSVYSPSLSPDGKLVAVDISGDSNQGDIWIVDSESGRSDPIVTWPEDDSYPVWSPDGSELAIYSMRGGGKKRIFRVDLATGGEPDLMLADEEAGLLPRFWSSDGRTLLFLAGESSRRDIMALDIESRDVRAIVADEFDTQNPSLSPDGRWIVFDSDMTGGKEVYLAPFPDASRKVRVSTDGGFAPLWSRDGSEIFFATASQDAIFSVDVTFDADEPRLGRPTKLFSVEMRLHRNRQYDTADGQTFLVNVILGGGVRTPLTVIQNWADGS